MQGQGRPGRPTSFTLVGLAAVVSGCVIERYPPGPGRAPVPLAPEVQERFAYEVLTAPAPCYAYDDGVAAVWTGQLTLRLTGPQPGGARAPQPQPYELWLSRRAPARAPAVLVTPILGGGQGLMRSACRGLAEAGFHVLFAKRGVKVLRREWPLEDVETNLRLAVAARQALIDELVARPEVDPERLGAFGISLGGIVTACLAAAEPRLKASVICLAGDDVPRLIRVSQEDRLVKYRQAKQIELETDAVGVEQALRKVFFTEPAELAQAVDPGRTLVVTTRYDELVPTARQESLWRALGQPLRYDIPSGHQGGILYLPYVIGLSQDWLRQQLR